MRKFCFGRDMKKDISHLPKRKQDEIKYITNKIRKLGKIEFIILYGSYARGDHVEHDVTYAKGLGYPEEFKSDIDILLVLRDAEAIHKNYLKLHGIQSKLIKEFVDQKIKSPVSLIFDDIMNINERLTESNPFFKDVMKQGIELYSSNKYKFNKDHKMAPPEKKKLAQRYFDHWYEKAQSSLKVYNFCFKKKENNLGAFHLHQITEACLHGLLLIFTFYAPKSHDIERLLRDTKKFDTKLPEIFLRETKEDNRLFELLKDSYVDARYSPAFKITRQELRKIYKSVKKLLKITEKICSERIKNYE